MPGRHVRAARHPRGMRWLLGAGALLVAGAAGFATSPANASTTVNAQLSLSGVATKANVLGGSLVGIHPSDKVNFTASALPTAGLENIPALGSLLNTLLNPLLGQYQVVVNFSSSFPGGAQTVTLGGPTTGKCAGLSAKAFTFPNKGTYNFTWKVQYVLPLLLGCTKTSLSDTDLNQLATAGVKINASNQWVGQIVVADNPPAGGISIQLPSVQISPSLPVVGQLPALSIPGATLPTLKVAIPDLTKTGTKSSGTSAKTTKPGAGINYTQPGLSIPEQVVPKGAGDAGGGAGVGGYFPGVLPGSGSQLGNLPGLQNTNSAAGATAPGVTSQDSTGKNKTIDLASSSKSPSAQLPVILAIFSIIALALVAGTYARLFLLRRRT